MPRFFPSSGDVTGDVVKNGMTCIFFYGRHFIVSRSAVIYLSRTINPFTVKDIETSSRSRVWRKISERFYSSKTTKTILF